MGYSGYNEAKKRSNEKYLAKFDSIRIRVLPEFKKQIEQAAHDDGKSVQAYLIEALKEKMGIK
jgi:predicted HicB family RNase H-like nuclease